MGLSAKRISFSIGRRKYYVDSYKDQNKTFAEVLRNLFCNRQEGLVTIGTREIFVSDTNVECMLELGQYMNLRICGVCH